jgi:8-oxo-dGTP pyrophosphatase MutT (NUDIX family)
MISAVYIVLFDEQGKVLIQHRDDDAPTAPGFWSLFGGRVEEDETFLQAVKRECYEELEYRLENPILVYEEEFIWKGKKAKSFFFIEKYDRKQKIVLHEGQGMKWIIIDDIQKMKSKLYIINALMLIKNKLRDLR